MELIKILNKFDKSKIKAGDGRKDGIYPLYTCSPKVNKFLDNYLYDTEAIILGTGGNPVINYHKGKFSYSSDCLVVQSKGKFENKYIYYYLISKINEIAKMFRGAGLKHLNKKEFFKMNIELINIEEQKKIIKELDLINKLMDYKRKQIKLFDDFIKSQFVEMFENNKFEKKNLRDVAIKITDGSHNPPKGVDERTEYLMLSSQNIIEDRINYNNARYLSREDFEIENKRTYLEKGDVLLTIVGTIGRTAIIYNENNITLQRSVAVIKPIEEINSEYLAISLKSDDILKQLNKGSKGVAQKGIYLNDLKKILIPFPPITLQNQFSEIVKQIDKQKFESMIQLDKENRIVLRNIIKDTLEETNSIYEFLLKKYFEEGK